MKEKGINFIKENVFKTKRCNCKRGLTLEFNIWLKLIHITVMYANELKLQSLVMILLKIQVDFDPAAAILTIPIPLGSNGQLRCW